MVGWLGLEPRTNGLKGRCSTNLATNPTNLRGCTRLCAITPANIENCVLERKKDGTNSPSLNIQPSALRNLFKFAQRMLREQKLPAGTAINFFASFCLFVSAKEAARPHC